MPIARGSVGVMVNAGQEWSIMAVNGQCRCPSSSLSFIEDKPVHCMPNVTKTVSRTSLSTECLSAEPFNLNSVSFSQAIYTSDVSSARQNSVPM